MKAPSFDDAGLAINAIGLLALIALALSRGVFAGWPAPSLADGGSTPGASAA
jgi:hypothetical protein